jgi:hypothetical protein
MTLDQKKIAVAKACGWERCQCGCNRWLGPGDKTQYGTPPIDTDANARPEMLAEMTGEEKRTLVSMLWRQQNSPAIFDIELCVKLLELTQPEFFELFGKAKGLW